MSTPNQIKVVLITFLLMSCAVEIPPSGNSQAINEQISTETPQKPALQPDDRIGGVYEVVGGRTWCDFSDLVQTVEPGSDPQKIILGSQSNASVRWETLDGMQTKPLIQTGSGTFTYSFSVPGRNSGPGSVSGTLTFTDPLNFTELLVLKPGDSEQTFFMSKQYRRP
jgi:hypothetical protein